MEKIKFGVFGLGRGASFIGNMEKNGAELVAVCDKDEKLLNKFRERYPDAGAYDNFDDFICHEGLDAIVVANYFHEHAPFAIKALEKNIHVLSECTPAGTMGEAVALVRAAEKSDAIYMLAENYPYMKFNQEMRRVYQRGDLGKVLYAEGEYNHPIWGDWVADLCPDSKHWRYHMPRVYYITHALAPLCYITGAMPKRVSAFPVSYPHTKESFGSDLYWRLPDRSAIVSCFNDDGSVYRVTGWSQFGAEDNTYRICGTKGQIENIRGEDDQIMLRFNSCDQPEGMKHVNKYTPEWNIEDKALAENAGHGGGDFFTAKVFCDCIRENKQPMFDVYFATTLSAVAILAHKSALEYGMPYDVPNFRLEEDLVKWENNFDTPMWGSDGTAPTIPNTELAEYVPNEQSMAEYDRAVEAFYANKK
ncbi:MAG: Gfo/Idh/MocA family oxidoreductase [Clostridia bacterium]|nr:Gfo/Idh/MocA family oxidoreductase [Clostridia bacterium]